MSPREIARCLDRNPTARVAANAAPSLVGLGNGLEADDRIIGRGALWVSRDAVQGRPGLDIVEGDWHAKFPWFRTKPGSLRATGRRIDGPGNFTFDLPPESSYPDIGFIPSGLHFSNGGCWKITARFRRTTIHFFMSFSSSPEAVCAEIEWQLNNVAALRASTPPGYVWPPENDALALRLNAASNAACGAES